MATIARQVAYACLRLAAHLERDAYDRPRERQVQLIRRAGKPDTLTLSAATEQWLRHGYEQRMSTAAVRRDLGEILAHGERERDMGQGEAAEQPDAQAF